MTQLQPNNSKANERRMSNEDLLKLYKEVKEKMDKVTIEQIEAMDINEVTKRIMLELKAKMMQNKKQKAESELKLIEAMEKI